MYPEQYADGFAKSPDLVREEASHEIRMLNADGLVKPSQWGNFLKSEAKIISNFLKASSDNFVAKIQFALSENSGYEQKPSFFRNEINNAIKNGVIKGDKINTVNGYLNSYTKRFKAEHEKRGLLIQGANLRLHNIPISDPKIKSAINKEQGNIQIEFIGSNGALQKDVPNILDVDEIKREASIKKTVENSYSKGVLHPHLKDVFNSTSWLQTEDDFKLVMSAWKSYMMHAVNKDRKNGEWEALSIAKQNGVNVVLMQQAHLYGFEHTKKLSQGGTSSSDRKLSALGADGANFDERFMDLFNEVIVDQSWYEWVFGEDYVTSGQRDNLNIYNTQTGTNSLSGALMSNPRVKNLIMNKATAIFNSNKYAQNEEGMKLSIVSAMSDLSGTIGLQDMPNGTKEWTMFPIVTQAKASAGHVPIDWDNETWKKRIITDAIEKSQIKNAAYSPKMIDAINDGKLVFIVNETYGSKPDYSVFVEMDNERHKILNNYSYNFFKSNDYDDYNSAINQIENSWWRNLISSIPGAKPWIVDQTVSDWAENNDFDSTIKKLVYAYNTMGSYINMKYPIGTVDLSSAPTIASGFENDAQATVKPDRDFIHKFTIPPITKKDRKAIEAWLENWITGY